MKNSFRPFYCCDKFLSRCACYTLELLIKYLDTISDGSGGAFEQGSITYDICKEVVDEFILVSEDEIKQSIKLMIDAHHKIIEGAAGVALASFLKKKDNYAGKNVVILLCGANIATEKLKEIL